MILLRFFCRISPILGDLIRNPRVDARHRANNKHNTAPLISCNLNLFRATDDVISKKQNKLVPGQRGGIREH